MAVSGYPRIPYVSADFQTTFDAISAYIQSERPDLWTDFFESNLGTILIDIVALVNDQQNYMINRVSEEMFLPTARLYESALNHAKTVGYPVRPPTAASVDLTVTMTASLITAMAANPLVIPAGTQLQIGQQTYVTVTQFTFPAGDYTVLPAPEFTMVEGEPVQDSFVSDGSTFQEYTTSEGEVIANSTTVTVNSVEWSAAGKSISLVLGPEQVYQEEYINNEGNLKIIFGDDATGAKPPNGSLITVSYRVGGGVDGNLAAGAINGTISAIAGGTVSLFVTNAAPASGGADRETLEEIQLNVPAWVRTVDKAITAEDYETLSSTFEDPTFGAIVKAKARLREGSLLCHTGPGSTPVTVPAGTTITIAGENFDVLTEFTLQAEDAYVFMDPNTVDVLVWTATNNPPFFTTASTDLRRALFFYLKERTITTVCINVLNGANETVDVDLGTVNVAQGFDLATVEADITAAIYAFFKRADFGPGQPIRINDLTNVIKSVRGMGDGSYWTYVTPTADVFPADDETLLVLGTLSMTLQEATTVPLPNPFDDCP